MKNATICSVSLTALALGLIVPTGARAAASPSTPPTLDAKDAPPPVQLAQAQAHTAPPETGTKTDAAPQTAPNSSSGDIVVTARRIAESAERVPVSLTVQTGQDLVRSSTYTFGDLQQRAPSLHVTPAVLSSGSAFISMRGQIDTQFRLTTDTAVGIYIDGVYYPHGFGTAASDFWDIDRVEVLRGSQGTLYGRSTTAGAISIYTARPSFDWQTAGRLRYGSYNELGMAAMVNVPLSSNAGFRFDVEHHGHDGFGTNLITRQDLGSTDATSLRAALRWEPTPQLRFIARGDYARLYDVFNAYKGGVLPFAIGTPLPTGGTVGAVLLAEVAAELGLTGPNRFAQAAAIFSSYAGGNPNDGSLDLQPFDRSRIYGGSLTAEYDVAPDITLRSITGYRHFNRRGANDLDGTPFQILEYPFMATVDRQFSEEAQLAGNLFDNRAKFIVGAIYTRETGTDQYTQRAVQTLSRGAVTIQYGDILNRSVGIYGQTTIKLFDGLSATGGLRWSSDHRGLTSGNNNGVVCVATGVPLATNPVCRATYDVTFKKLSYTAGLEYQATPDLLVYAKTNRGYRTGGLPYSGGSAISPAAAAFSFTPVKPEVTQDYEAGLKLNLHDPRLTFNIDYYHTDYSDIQVSISVPNPNGPGTIGLITNGAKAKIDGVEAEARWQPLQGLELGGTLAYTHARYTKFIAPPSNFTGQPLYYTPKWTYTLTGAYTIPTSFGSARAQADFDHEGRALSNLPLAYRGAINILNARLSATINRPNMTFSVFAKNLTNDRFYPFRLDTLISFGALLNFSANNPRTFGVEIQKNF